MMRLIRIALIILLLLPSILVGLILIALQTDAVRENLLTQLNQFTATQPVQVQIEQLEGRIPDAMRLGRIQISDSEGIWLEIEDLILDWAPFSLLSGRLQITDLSAKRIAVLRQPELPPSPEDEPSAPMHWPSDLPPIDLQSLAVETIEVGPEIAGEPLKLSLNAGIDGVSQEEIRIKLFQIKTADSVARLQGSLNPKIQQMNLQLDIDIPALGLFSALSGTKLAGSLEARATAHGSFTQPKVQISLKGQGLEAADTGIAELQADLRTQSTDTKTMELIGTGHVLEIKQPALAVPVDNITWTLGALLEGYDQLTLDKLDLNLPGLKVKTKGNFNLTSQQGHLEARLNATDIASLAPLTGGDAGGQAQLDLSLDVTEKLQRIQGQLDASGTALSGLPADIAGKSPIFKAGFQLNPDKQLHIDGLKLDGTNLVIEGSLIAGLPDGILDGQLNLNLADLAPYSKLAGQSLGGRLDGKLVLTGKLNAPKIQLRTRGQQLVVDERKLGNVEMDTNLAGTAQQHYKGTARLTATAPEGTLSATTDYAIAPTRFALDNLQATGPGMQISGQLVSELPITFPSGVLKGEIKDLATLSPWLGPGYAGHIRFALDAPVDNPEQRTLINADAEGVKTPFGRLDRLVAQLDASHVLTSPTIKADITLKNFDNAAGIKITQLNTNLAGPLNRLQLNYKLQGQHEDKPFRLDSESIVSIEATSFGAEISRFEMDYDKVPIRLSDKLQLDTVSNDQVAVQPFELRIGGGQLKAQANLSPTNNQAKVEARLPLSLIKSFSGPEIAGNAIVNARLMGTPENPIIKAKLGLTDLKPADAEKNLPAMSIDANALMENGMAKIFVRMLELSDRPGELHLQLPVTLTLNPFSLEVPEQGEIQGQADLSIALDRVTKLLALKDPVLEGILNTTFAIAGSLSDPLLTGNATLTQGRVASDISGTLLEEFKLDLEAQGRRINLRELSASDGDSGRLNLAGDVNLSALDNPEFNLQLDLDSARLVRRPEADATLSGVIVAKGKLQEMNVKGAVTVNEAKIEIPGNTGPSIPEIQVTEVNIPGAEPDEDKSGGTGENIGLAVVIDMPARVFVRGRGLDSEWGGKLNIQGSAYKPRIVGDINVRRGRFNFLDRRFKLREGSIQFSGAMPPEPYIDLEAAAELSELIAIVRIQGLATHPDILLSADPERPQDEILAQILFDRSTSDITPFQAAKLAAAVNQLRGGKSVDPTGSLRDYTGLDALDVGVDESGNVSISAGKYINDKTYLQFKPGIGTSGGKLRVERELSRKFSADAELEDDGGTSVGFGWKYDY